MNCRKASNLLSAYMDGELPGVEQLLIRDHLKVCESCRDEYESLLFTKRLLCGLQVKDPADSLETRIRRSIAAECRRAQPETTPKTAWETMVSWWQVLAYAQKLRYSAALAVCSVLIAAVTITPQALRKPDEPGFMAGPTFAGSSVKMERDLGRAPFDGRIRSILPTLHDPSTNPPSANGAPLLIPVSADEVGVRNH